MPEPRDWRKMLEQKNNSLSYFWDCMVVEQIIEEVEQLQTEVKRLNEENNRLTEMLVRVSNSPKTEELKP